MTAANTMPKKDEDEDEDEDEDKKQAVTKNYPMFVWQSQSYFKCNEELHNTHLQVR